MKENRLKTIGVTFVALIPILILVLSGGGCDRNEPIKLGFVGGLTGRNSNLGVAGREGALLAVEQANEKGGIKGRQIRLIVKNDEQNSDVALKVDKELIEEGAVAIVGHMTSSMSLAAVPLMNDEYKPGCHDQPYNQHQ